MTGRPALAALLAIGSAPAHADPRIASRPYEASTVVTLHGKAGIESTIAFGDDERIENVAVGNSAAWQVTPNKRANLLFVKPAGPRAHTNMTVVTDQHTYLFDLVSGAAAPTYMLRFTYPAAPRPAQAALAGPVPTPAATPDAAALAAAAPVPPVVNPADLNFAWRAKGDRRLLPDRSFDDGRSTYLQWPKDAALPAILVREAGGQEGPVNYTVKGGTIVVEGVPAEIILRSGRQVATLAPDPRPAAAEPPFAQTASARP